MTGAATLILHASCVAVDGRGLLILGPSGSGKSTLALQMIGLGARLVADDRVVVTRAGDTLTATAPPPLAGLIEARGLGLLRAEPLAGAVLRLALDLGLTETQRLPEPQSLDLHGTSITLLRGPAAAHFPAALMLYLRHGRAQ